MKRKFLFSIVTFLLVLLLVVACIAVVEIFFRTVMPPAKILPSFRYTSDVAELIKQPTKDLETHVRVELLPPLYPNSKQVKAPKTAKSKWYAPGFVQTDPVDGAVIARAGTYASSEVSHDGETIFSVKYTIDQNRRRIVPDLNPRATKSLLFLGCSYTFGEGVEDTETLPYYVSTEARKFSVTNFSLGGWGPGNILRGISKTDFAKDSFLPGGIAIYVYMDGHVNRAVGTLSITRSSPSWRTLLPYYELDANDELVSDGTLATGQPYRTWIYSWLSKSRLLSYFAVDIPPRFQSQHFKLVAKLAHEMKETLTKKAGFQEFYVMIYPGSMFGKPLIHFLDQYQIKSVDYSHLNLFHYSKTPYIVGDGHPGAEGNKVIARQLAHDLHLVEHPNE